MIGLIEAALLQVPTESKTPASQALAGGTPCSHATAVPAYGRQRDPDLQAVNDPGGGDVPLAGSQRRS
jgi:hypothetical protein